MQNKIKAIHIHQQFKPNEGEKSQ